MSELYTKGIRKVSEATLFNKSNEQCMAWAANNDVLAYSFNGDIYCRVDGTGVKHVYRKTCFRIEDFQV